MRPRLYRLPDPFGGRLAVSARPRSAPELWIDATGWRVQGVNMVVSMLEPEEAEVIGLAGQAEALAKEGIEFVNLPIEDFRVPDNPTAILATVDKALGCLQGGGSVVAHCFAGMGRSPLFVGAVLVRNGLETQEAFDLIGQARGARVPATGEQWQWLADFEAGLLTTQSTNPR